MNFLCTGCSPPCTEVVLPVTEATPAYFSTTAEAANELYVDIEAEMIHGDARAGVENDAQGVEAPYFMNKPVACNAADSLAPMFAKGGPMLPVAVETKFKTEQEVQAEKQKLRELVINFVKGAVCGVPAMLVDGHNGDRKPVNYQLDKNLSRLVITPIGGQKERNQSLIISLKNMPDACRFEDRIQWSDSMMVMAEEDRDCLVVFQNSGTPCLLLDSKASRDRFITCIKILSLYSSI